MAETTIEKTTTACPKCGSLKLVKDYESGQLICSNCGLVVRGQSYDRGPDWRSYNREEYEKKSRAGPPRTESIHDRGLSTQISWKNRDARGKPLSPKRRSEMYRLRKWQKRSRIADPIDRNLTVAFGEISRMSSQLGLPQSVEESACTTYREVAERGLVRGRSIEGVASAAVYIECRRAEIPRTLEEVAEVSRVGIMEISHAQKFIQRKLDIHPQTVDPSELVNRLGSELDLSPETRKEALNIIRKVKELGLTSGRSPSGIATGALYIACFLTGENRTQDDIANVGRVTEVTLRNRYKEIADELGIKVDLSSGRESETATPTRKEEDGREARRSPRVKDIEVKDVKIENIVATVDFEGVQFDLDSLAEELDGAEYDPDTFPGISYSPEEIKPVFLVFDSGKTNCVGSSSFEELDRAVDSLTRKLDELGVAPNAKPRVETRNIVLRANFSEPIDLGGLHESPHETSYEPEKFPGLHIKLEEVRADFLLFASGQGVGHVKKRSDIESALEEMKNILVKFAIEGLDDEAREILTWLSENPRFLKLMRVIKGGAKTVSRAAEELDVKKRTAEQYARSLARRKIVEKKKNGEAGIVLTRLGENVLDIT